MFNILEVVKTGFSILNTSMGAAGSLVTIIDHFKNQTSDQTLRSIRENSKVAYERYCEYRKYRQEDLGVPLEKDILGYWEDCLQRGTLPSASDMAASGIASEEEAEIMMPYLMEQWMRVPDFSAWIHDILGQNQLEKISEALEGLPEVLEGLPEVLEAASQIKAQLETQEIYNMATLITPGYINDAKRSCSDSMIRNFFTVDNNFHTMLQVISADEDVPHKEASQAVEELLKIGSPVIIAGNGGQGKTSLMMRAAAQWASSGRLTVWMSLSNKETITEAAADRFFDCLINLTPAGQSVLLCIDNPFEGRASFSSLQARWPHNAKIHLLMAERENRLTLLADPDQDLLLRWFDGAELVVLQGGGQARPYGLKKYPPHYFPESRERRKAILRKSTSYLVKEGAISQTDQASVIDGILGRHKSPHISLVELIYRTLFELKKIASKPESIKLDWEEWGELIRREFGQVDSDLQLYGVIAALKVFNTPLSLSLFCKYFGLEERKLKNRLSERFLPRHVEPVVYQEGSRTLQPKHDVIAELFFLFNESKVTINSLIFDLIEVMDEHELEAFLANVINKREVRRGSKYPIGRIDYWSYMERIYSQVENRNIHLSRTGRVNLCLGVLWARKQRNPGTSPAIDTILEHTAPEIEHDLLTAKLYTEWGIWLAEQKRDSSAEEKFLSVIKTDPLDIHSRTELGRLLSRQTGREKEAEQYLLQAIRIDPKNLHPHTELGRLLSKQKGREKKAEQYLLQAIRIDPKNLHPHTELGRLLSRQTGREKEAEQYLLQAVKIAPKDIQSRTELGRLLSRQTGREKEAEEFLLQAIKIDPKNLHPHTELGRLLSRQTGREKEAEEFLLQVIRIDPKNIQSRTELGRLLSRQTGREKEAEQYLLQAVKIAPKHIQSRTELGRLLSKQTGREREAEQYLLQAIAINPKHLHSRTVLAKLYEKMDRLPEAKRLYQELCDIDPGNRFGKEGLSRLK